MTDPTLVAAAALLDDSLTAMREVIARADPQALDWRPGPDTNPIAVLAVHSMHSTRSWLSAATGAPMPDRDRPSEFLATAEGMGEMLDFFDAMAGECRALLDPSATFEPGAIRGTGHGGDETATAAWSLMHALEHLREHVAHAQLTLQLWEMKHPRA